MKKTLCMLMTAAFLFSMTSCSTKKSAKSNVKTVAKDSIWWNDQVTVINEDVINQAINDKVTSMVDHICLADKDSVVFEFEVYCQKKMYTQLLMRYSYDGKCLGKIDFVDCLGMDDDFQTVYKLKDKYYSIVNHYDEDAESYFLYSYEIDFEQGTVKDPVKIDVRSKNGSVPQIRSVTGVGDKLVYLLETDSNDGQSYEIRVDDGKDPRFYIPSFGNTFQLSYISDVMKDGNDIVFCADGQDNGKAAKLYCKLNLDTFALTKKDMGLSDSDPSFVEDCGIFTVEDYNKICKFDVNTGTDNELLDLSASYLNGMLYNLQIVWADNNSVVICDSGSFDTGVSLIRLSKAETNPNAGRKILRAAYFDDVLTSDYAAVNAFNRESDTYFIEMDPKYYDIQTSKTGTSELEENGSLRDVYSANAVTTLMSDIRDGNGPDLVFYSYDMAQLNSSEYLIDLTSRIGSEAVLNDGSYMDFIKQPNGRDGKIYRLDYTFLCNCILINNDYVPDGAKGLTYEEYDRIIEEKNNGKDALDLLGDDGLPLMRYLMFESDCFSYGSDGKIDLSSGNFRKTAEFVKSIVQKNQHTLTSEWRLSPIQAVGNFDFDNYLFYCGPYYDRFSIIGMPTSDGHAESICGWGIGITSCSALQDGAWEFVMKMLSSDVQKTTGCIPVLKSAQKEVFKERLDEYNLNPSANAYGEAVPEGIVDRFIAQISDAVVVPDLDSSVIVIVNEELPAFFEGQKTLDEVISVIENRLNLMLKEKKASA